MRRLVWRVGLLAAVQCCNGVAATGNKAARLEEVVSRYERLGYLNGSVLVAEGGKVIYSRGVGAANIETHRANTPQTKFGIASLTKQFTAVLVLQQAAEGRIQLGGKVSDYLPWYRRDTGERMTVEQLLHHTSGLPADFDTPEFSDSAEASRHYEPIDFAQRFCQPTLVSEPGMKWNYSNCGYDLLGLILESISGRSFSDLLHQRLLEPLGMQNTGMNRNDLEQLEGASGYTRHAGPRYTPGRYLDQDHIFAAGAMYSTVEDLFLWNQALTRGGLLSKEMRAQIFKPSLNNWAYGWFVTRIPAGEPGAGNMRAEMRGDMPGNYFAWMLRYPEKNAVIIVLRNGYGSTEHLEENLQAILFDRPPRLPSRSPKDVAAAAYFRTIDWVTAHRIASTMLLLLAIAAITQTARRNRGGILPRNPPSV